MITVREIALALTGTWRLMLADRSALAMFQLDTAGAIRSFVAALIVLPAYVVLVLLRLWDDLGSVSLIRLLTIETIAYVINWTAYALIMVELTRFLDCGQRYTRFLCVYNWSSVIQMGIYLPVTLISQTGLLPGVIDETMMLAMTIGLLGYQWFLTLITLEIPMGTAAGLVLLDLILSVFVSGTADGML